MLDANPQRQALVDRLSTREPEPPAEMTVPETMSVLARYMPIVLAAALTIGALTFVISSMQTKQFDANGRLELSTQVDYYDIDGKRFAADTFLKSDETIATINAFASSIGTEILAIRVDLPPDSKGIDVNVSATTATGASAVTDELLSMAAANDDAKRAETIDTAREGIRALMDRLEGEMADLDAQISDVLTQQETATNTERNQLQDKLNQLQRDRNTRQDQRNQYQREIDNLELDLDYRRANLEVAWKALTPVDASRPKPARNGLLGFLLGGMMGAAMVMVFFRDRARVSDSERLGAHLSAPVLAESSPSLSAAELMPASIAIDRRASGQRVGALSLADAAVDQEAAKTLNMLTAQRMDEVTRTHWLQVPPGTPGAPWIVACGDMDSADSAAYLNMVDSVILTTLKGKVSVRRAHAAASRLRALGIDVLGVVVVS